MIIIILNERDEIMELKYTIPSGQSSPGILQSGQLASNGILHMPQLSSLAIQRQVATPVQPEERAGKLIYMKDTSWPRKFVNIGHNPRHNHAFVIKNSM